MTKALNTRTLEARLAKQLEKDRWKPSRFQGVQRDGTIIYVPSSAAVGLAIAINQRTGEDVDAILNRVVNES